MAAENQRLVEMMAELLAEARETKVIQQSMAGDMQRMAGDIREVKEQTVKNNAAIGELRLSVMRLADKIEEIYHLDQRVKVLEEIVLPK